MAMLICSFFFFLWLGGHEAAKLILYSLRAVELGIKSLEAKVSQAPRYHFYKELM